MVTSNDIYNDGDHGLSVDVLCRQLQFLTQKTSARQALICGINTPAVVSVARKEARWLYGLAIPRIPSYLTAKR